MSPACLNPMSLRVLYYDSDRYPQERGRSFKNPSWPLALYGAGERRQFAAQFGVYSQWFGTSFAPDL